MYTESFLSDAGNGFLEPHELWRPECNLMADMLDLSNIDPHLMMVVFLPTLLFESAFAMDVAFFYSQAPTRCPLLTGPYSPALTVFYSQAPPHRPNRLPCRAHAGSLLLCCH